MGPKSLKLLYKRSKHYENGSQYLELMKKMGSVNDPIKL